MKKISSTEQKQIMLEMLKFLDKICRDNNINYSLIGGSLIGAIRHQGYIPWDDDIDIILTKDNYDKLKLILDKETGRYQTLKFGRGGEQFNFLKLIDTYTGLKEKSQTRTIPDYGIFIDIFCYYPTSDNEKLRRKQFKRIKLLNSLVARRKLDFKNASLKQNFLRIGKNIISKSLGYKRLNKICEKAVNRYSDTEYVMSSWLAYGYDKEIQLTKNTKDYINAKFEGLTVMIFKNYDAILRTAFGNYMQLPPPEDRRPRHNLNAWWRKK